MIIFFRGPNLDGRLSGHSLAQDNRSLGYDPVGNIETLDDGVDIRHFGYDELNRLLTAEVPYQTFGYDLNGNRRSLSEDAGLSEYIYAGDSNRLLEVQGKQPRSYNYDAAGNITHNGAHSFGFNARDRLESIDDGAIGYTYNGQGQRIGKSVVGSATRFFYDEAGRPLGEYDTNGQERKAIVSFDDRPIAVLRGATVYPIHADHLGTPRAITDATGTKVWKWVSDPFGTTAPIEDPDGDGQVFVFNMRFPGQYYDQEAGLHYNYFRDYDPATGRYLESDPIGLRGGINSYTYSYQNPIIWTDKLGLFGDGRTYGPDADPNRPPGHSDMYGSGDFDYTAEDHGWLTSPFNPFGGSDRHFRPYRQSLQDAISAIMNCDKRSFERAMHRFQDYFSHFANGYRWQPGNPNVPCSGFGHACDGTLPDSEIEAWRRANEHTKILADEFRGRCGQCQ